MDRFQEFTHVIIILIHSVYSWNMQLILHMNEYNLKKKLEIQGFI